VTDPKLGETILDPACGTGGFLVEAMTHLEQQCNTVEDRETLQHASLYGGEAKPLPYLLVQMNLLLHGLEYPRIDPENSLRFPLREIGDRDRVDLILTNPPFGGEEEGASSATSPRTCRPPRRRCCFCNSSCASSSGRGGVPNSGGGRAAVRRTQRRTLSHSLTQFVLAMLAFIAGKSFLKTSTKA
jgi:type I restriction enzyme M protein